MRSALGTDAGGADLKSSAIVPVVIILTVVGYGGDVLVMSTPSTLSTPSTPSTLSTLSTTSDPHHALHTHYIYSRVRRIKSSGGGAKLMILIYIIIFVI